MSEKIVVELDDFTVEYRKSDSGLNVKVYVDGDLVEERQSTWFMRVLLDEALKLKNK